MLPTYAVGAEVTLEEVIGEARRGRVIVFGFPGKPGQQYLKRIVGIPGDTVSTEGPEVMVNGVPVPRCRVGAWSYAETDGGTHRGELWLEALDGARWLVFEDDAGSVAAPRSAWSVPAGEVFVLADNRDNSTDSRVWFGGKGGGLPVRWIVGTAADVAAPTLPKGAEPLEADLERCLASLRVSDAVPGTDRARKKGGRAE
jgi:signal peptidase I